MDTDPFWITKRNNRKKGSSSSKENIKVVLSICDCFYCKVIVQLLSSCILNWISIVQFCLVCQNHIYWNQHFKIKCIVVISNMFTIYYFVKYILNILIQNIKTVTVGEPKIYCKPILKNHFRTLLFLQVDVTDKKYCITYHNFP